MFFFSCCCTWFQFVDQSDLWFSHFVLQSIWNSENVLLFKPSVKPALTWSTSEVQGPLLYLPSHSINITVDISNIDIRSSAPGNSISKIESYINNDGSNHLIALRHQQDKSAFKIKPHIKFTFLLNTIIQRTPSRITINLLFPLQWVGSKLQ